MAPPRFLIEDPGTLLSWLSARRDEGWASFGEVDVAQIQPVVSNRDAPDDPGTLVVFEAASSQAGKGDDVIADVHELARGRSRQRIARRWIRFGDCPSDIGPLVVKVAAEDTVAAHELFG